MGLPGFLIRWLINAAALAVAAYLLPGIAVADWQALLIAALILGLVNAIIKPVLKLVTCPLVVLTAGLFTLVINAAMLGLTAWLADNFDVGFTVDGIGTALLGALIVTIVSWALTQVTD